MPLDTHSDRLWCGNVGCHNFMFVGTPETHGTIPPNQEQIFCVLLLPVRVESDLRVPHTLFYVWIRGLLDCGISHGLWLLRVSLPVCRQRLSGQAGRGRGIGSPVLSLPYSLFAFSCDGGREAHRLMLFAWPFIMHDMIHNLLSFVYHLQPINNVILASCFFSICHCCLSSFV